MHRTYYELVALPIQRQISRKRTRMIDARAMCLASCNYVYLVDGPFWNSEVWGSIQLDNLEKDASAILDLVEEPRRSRI